MGNGWEDRERGVVGSCVEGEGGRGLLGRGMKDEWQRERERWGEGKEIIDYLKLLKIYGIIFRVILCLVIPVMYRCLPSGVWREVLRVNYAMLRCTLLLVRRLEWCEALCCKIVFSLEGFLKGD